MATTRPLSCFISAPFGLNTESLEEILRSRGFLPRRLDDLESGSDVLGDLVTEIKQSDLVLAVVPKEEGRESAFFEIGLARGLDRPLAILIEPGAEVPFELGALEYTRGNVADPATLQIRVNALLDS